MTIRLLDVMCCFCVGLVIFASSTTLAQDETAKPEETTSEQTESEEAESEEAEAQDTEPVSETADGDAEEEASSEDSDSASSTASQEGTRAEEVLTGLNNPTGVAIQPETGTVFVADSGNYKVVKLVDGKAEDVITDFPKDVYGKEPKLNIGPLGLTFLDQNTLVVGGGGLPDGEELLRVYKLPEDGKPMKADAMENDFKLASDGDTVGEGNFYALATTPDAIYVTCNGDDEKGWVSRATLEGTKLTNFERFLATKEATEVDAPVGITISPDGDLVVGQMGEISVLGDSLLTWYDANEKEMLLNLKTGLHDICAIAYSKRGQMYVLDYAWADPSQGGLFQILEDNNSETGMKAERLMTLDKPTAMAFDSNGDLYITVVGEAKDANSEGKLLKVTKEAGL